MKRNHFVARAVASGAFAVVAQRRWVLGSHCRNRTPAAWELTPAARLPRRREHDLLQSGREGALHDLQAQRRRGHLICPSAKFHDDASQPAQSSRSGAAAAMRASCAPVPIYCRYSIHRLVVRPRRERALRARDRVDAGWLGRFQAVKSKVETVNVNPALSWEPTKFTSAPVSTGKGSRLR